MFYFWGTGNYPSPKVYTLLRLDTHDAKLSPSF